jgi:subtilisin-like proprotein convertase family protein
MTIPSNAPGGTSGYAFPYPWGVYVGQEGTTVGKVQVRLQELTHSFPDDLDVLLVGPAGQKVLLMSDAGGGGDISNRILTFDDEAEFLLPDTALLTDGTYLPSNYNGGDADTFVGTAPPGPYAGQLSAFKGTDAKGYWNLFVMDDATGDVGSLGGWCLDILPLYPVGEATNLRWSGSSKTTLTWDAAPNATGYQVLRGSPNFLGKLLTDETDSCIAVSPSGQIASGLAQMPGTGSMFWYLVVGTNGGPIGPSGRARIVTTDTARMADPVGSCNAP